MSICLDIEKRLGNFDLKVKLEAENEVLALLGASGCGKSMTLKCIAGIEKPDRGRIIVDGTTLFDSENHINLSPQKRRCGLMFQNYALFPNMNVRQNIYTGTKRDKEKRLRSSRTEQIMERFGLTELAEHLPSQISGGQQQRTALARILVSDPQILLLDEPFSALDSHLRFQMEQEVCSVLKSFGKTAILVSHDRDEVFRLADQIAVMHNGQIEICGPKKNVFANPETRNACILTGCKNISPVRKLDAYHLLAVDWGMELETEKPIDDASYIGIRHHAVYGIRTDCMDVYDAVCTAAASDEAKAAAVWTGAAGMGTSGVGARSIEKRSLEAFGMETPGVEKRGLEAFGMEMSGVENLSGLSRNIFLCEVVHVIENPFTYTVMMKLAGKPDAKPFGWEMDKPQWEQICAKHLKIHIPANSILLLRD